jgi:hypothetical protein
MTPDNPYAVAFAFWHAVLNEKYDDLELVITPESRGQWNLADIHARTEDSGIATGVIQTPVRRRLREAHLQRR